MRALIIGWAIGGTCYTLINPIVRLGQLAAEHLPRDPGVDQLVFGVIWCGFMVYTEGWRGFHKQFSPRVVRRAWALAEDPAPLRVILGPVMVMGLIHATRRRLTVSWALVAMIVALILAVRQLPPEWRSLVDLGVVLGLSAGLTSIAYHWVRAIRGSLPEIDPDLPEIS